MTDPDSYESTLAAQGWYRNEAGRLTHPGVEKLLVWWRSLPESVRTQYDDPPPGAERQK